MHPPLSIPSVDRIGITSSFLTRKYGESSAMERELGRDDDLVATNVSLVVVVVVVLHSASGSKPTGPLWWTTRNVHQQTTNLGLALPFVYLLLLEFRLSRSHSLRWS